MDHFSQEQIDAFQAAFNHIDQDGSGSIDASEVAGLVQAQGKSASPHQIETFMSENDLDGNGTITFNEFFTVVG